MLLSLQSAGRAVLLLALVHSAFAVEYDLLNDKNNCGRIGHVCHENDGIASCDNGVCQLECNDGWVNKNGICAETKAHKKQRLRQPISLCPTGETACPILGSKSFEDFHHSQHQLAEFLSAKGGYECLDVTTSLESCGGCSSTGQGTDCTKIPHSSGVGCSGGQCFIFSCEPGYVPSMDGSVCQKKSRKNHGLKKKHRH